MWPGGLQAEKTGQLVGSQQVDHSAEEQLRNGWIPSFRRFKEATQAKRELNLSWSEQTRINFEK